MVEVKDEWIKRGLFCEFDRDKAKKGCEWLYEMSGLKKPMFFVFDSPMGSQLGLNYLFFMFKKNQVKGQVWKQVREQVWKQVWKQIREQVWKQVREQVREQVGKQDWEQVWEQVKEQVGKQVREQVWKQVREQVWKQVWKQIREQVWKQVREQVEDQVRDQVKEQVEDQVRDQVKEQVGKQVWKQVRKQVEDIKSLKYLSFSADYLFWSLGWVSFYDFFEKIGVVKNDKFKKYKEFLCSGVSMSIFLEHICVVNKSPTFINKDERGRLHSTHDYAISWKDGYGQHYVDGIYFDSGLFNKLFKEKSITPKKILSIKNTEQKAVAIKYYGYDKMLKHLEHVVLDTYEGISKVTNKPVKYVLIEFKLDSVKVRMVRVEDHTEHKITFLGVPIEESTETCIGAIKWTFGFNKDQKYVPDIET